MSKAPTLSSVSAPSEVLTNMDGMSVLEDTMIRELHKEVPDGYKNTQLSTFGNNVDVDVDVWSPDGSQLVCPLI